jgi:hypothetical protein
MSLMPIMRPKLPSADRLAPYLKSIDAQAAAFNAKLSEYQAAVCFGME